MELNKETLDKERSIEGFPIGKDEDIIKLSDPPHYTACPNPFINEFIEKNGTQYDEENDNYNVEPYTADVSEGKNDPIYNAHSYHTKVPHKAIMRYILHYTKPGDIVFDGFCGTGMTGVASQMCGNPDSLFRLSIEQDMKNIKWGARRAILNDLSVAATFISYNYNKPQTATKFSADCSDLISEIEKECHWMYQTNHIIDDRPQIGIDGQVIKGNINYTVWSDVYLCPNCNTELVFWNVAVDKENGVVKEHFNCCHCNKDLTKKDLEKLWVTKYDKAINGKVVQVKQAPVQINYTVGKKRYDKEPDEYDMQLLNKIEEIEIPYWYPNNVLPEGYNTEQPKKSHGITNVHHFFVKQNLYVLAKIYNTSKNNPHILCLIGDMLPRASKMHKIAVSRLNSNLSKTAGILTGTYYIPSNSIAYSLIEMLKSRVADVENYINKTSYNDDCIISCQSTTSMSNINDNSIDYIFTDPPFGENLMYSELNFLWEAWLKVFTNNRHEAIMNKVQNKTLNEYQDLIEKCFMENYRILKPGRWMTVEFHNSQNSVWNAIQEAILKSGFVIANVKTLDKKQGSFKQVTTTSAVKQDLIISAYKPKSSFVHRFLIEAGTEEGVWDFIREHLSKLPVVVESSGMLDAIPERQNYLLYDSMVAFHIQKGATVPLGAADFYLGLIQRFPERDGMYFLPGQVSIYDAKRITQELNEQMSLFVLDEKTAIQWLHKELATPQTYQDVQPKFLQELKQLKYEKMPELRDLLEENFLQDEQGKWYVPDVNKQSDLEKLRDKKLLKEFDEYRNSKGKLKLFRMEAIRAGFKHCWKEKDYKTIVNIGERMPEAVVQEDPSILMYYDNALTRIGD